MTAHGCVNQQGRPVRMPAWLADLAVDELTRPVARTRRYPEQADVDQKG